MDKQLHNNPKMDATLQLCFNLVLDKALVDENYLLCQRMKDALEDIEIKKVLSSTY